MKVHSSSWYRIAGVCLVVAMLMAGALTALAQSDDAKRVGLIVLFEDGRQHTEIVTVSADATTADVLKASELETTIATTDFGPALCAIAEEGCPADDCFCDPDHFWGFWLEDEMGDGWIPAPVGVGGHIPANGEVVGFAWTGFDEEYNATTLPPFYSFAELEGPTPEPGVTPPPAIDAFLREQLQTFCPGAPIVFGGGLLGLMLWRRRRG